MVSCARLSPGGERGDSPGLFVLVRILTMTPNLPPSRRSIISQGPEKGRDVSTYLCKYSTYTVECIKYMHKYLHAYLSGCGPSSRGHSAKRVTFPNFAIGVGSTESRHALLTKLLLRRRRETLVIAGALSICLFPRPYAFLCALPLARFP